MSDENKEEMKVEKSAEQKAQLSEKELDKVSGGAPTKSVPTESVSFSYEEIKTE